MLIFVPCDGFEGPCGSLQCEILSQRWLIFVLGMVLKVDTGTSIASIFCQQTLFSPILFEIQTVVTSTSVVIKRQVLYLNSNY